MRREAYAIAVVRRSLIFLNLISGEHTTASSNCGMTQRTIRKYFARRKCLATPIAHSDSLRGKTSRRLELRPYQSLQSATHNISRDLVSCVQRQTVDGWPNIPHLPCSHAE